MAFSAPLVATCALHVLLSSAVQVKHPEPDVYEPVESLKNTFIESVESMENTFDEFVEADGCARGHDCGILSKPQDPPVLVPCPDGDKWMAHDALFIPNPHGLKNLVYCAVPKVATSFTFWVMDDLKLEARNGKRNAGYQKVHEIVSDNDPHAIKELCNAYSFVIIRNPWDRIVSGYVDKVLTKTVNNKPQGFGGFMQKVDKTNSTILNHHFQPVSLVCNTKGKHRHEYDKVIRIEDDILNDMEDMFVHHLGIPQAKAHRSLQKAMDVGAHHSSKNFTIDRGQEQSGLSRVDYYFHQSDPEIVRRVFHDDIAFGHYSYSGHTTSWVDQHKHKLG